MNGTIHVGRCPLCQHTSDPLDSEATAREAIRGHLNAHAHGDLVGYAANAIEVERYIKETPHDE